MKLLREFLQKSKHLVTDVDKINQVVDSDMASSVPEEPAQKSPPKNILMKGAGELDNLIFAMQMKFQSDILL